MVGRHSATSTSFPLDSFYTRTCPLQRNDNDIGNSSSRCRPPPPPKQPTQLQPHRPRSAGQTHVPTTGLMQNRARHRMCRAHKNNIGTVTVTAYNLRPNVCHGARPLRCDQKTCLKRTLHEVQKFSHGIELLRAHENALPAECHRLVFELCDYN